MSLRQSPELIFLSLGSEGYLFSNCAAGQGRCNRDSVKILLSLLFSAFFFLISVLHLDAVISHLIHLALMKVYFTCRQ